MLYDFFNLLNQSSIVDDTAVQKLPQLPVNIQLAEEHPFHIVKYVLKVGKAAGSDETPAEI